MKSRCKRSGTGEKTPSLVRPKVGKKLPKRASICSERVKSSAANSGKNRLGPGLDMPKTGKRLPGRSIDRVESIDAGCTKSRVGVEKPEHTMP